MSSHVRRGKAGEENLPRDAGAADEAVQRGMARYLAELKDAEVQVPERLSAKTTPDVQYPHQCYYRSYRYVMDHAEIDGMWLIHGEFGLDWGHAWVELPGDIVFDGVLQRFYHRPAYYDLQGARPWYKYTFLAAFMVVIRMKQPSGLYLYASWHERLGLPWADPDNPTLIDDTRARELLVASGLAPELASWILPLLIARRDTLDDRRGPEGCVLLSGGQRDARPADREPGAADAAAGALLVVDAVDVPAGQFDAAGVGLDGSVNL